MRSLQSKFLALTVGCVLLTALALGYVGFLYTHKLVNEDSTQFMNLFCEDKAQEIDAALMGIEQSVNTIRDYTIEQYNALGIGGTGRDNVDAFVKKVQEVSLHTVKNTEGSRGVYMRVNPEIADDQTGFFWYRDEKGDVNEDSLVDFSKYTKDNTQNVGWYYEALENEDAFWMEPYNNLNKNDWIISYVVPIYQDEDFIGVLGMDIDMALLKEKVDSVQIYQSGRIIFLVTCIVITTEKIIITTVETRNRRIIRLLNSLISCTGAVTANSIPFSSCLAVISFFVPSRL